MWSPLELLAHSSPVVCRQQPSTLPRGTSLEMGGVALWIAGGTKRQIQHLMSSDVTFYYTTP
eukprot:jgi/Mesen1/1271/ME000013S00766